MLKHANDEKAIFLAALEQATAGEREAYLRRACGDDPELLKRLNVLMSVHQEVQGPLDAPSPGAGIAPTIDPPLTESPGTLIGPYKLLEQIGEGGFGVVFMAEQVKPIQRKVAVKIIKPGMDSRQVIARFEAERQALALMDHPNIAKVLDAGTTASGRPYFVMELVRGVPVTEFCDQKTLPVRDRLELFITICQAVQHAHQKGIIHRDIKPTNVLVTQQDGRPLAKVIDFGVAKATGQKLTEKTLFTGFAQLIGTPLYMSPEQAELSAQDVDTRSDIYSLGVVLYELLTGTTPFAKDRLKTATFDELRRIIREEEPPRPSTRLSTLAQQAISTVSTQRSSDPRHLSRLFQGELDWIVMKSLDKDRNRRYETASALAADVEHYLRDEPVLASPPSARYRLRKFLRRNRISLAVTTAIGIALLIAVASAAWVLRDRVARKTVLDEQISQALKESKTLYETGELMEAMSALKRAEGFIATGEATGEANRDVDNWRADLRTVQRLEQIRMDQALLAITKNEPGVRTPDGEVEESDNPVLDRNEADRAYRKEFERYGINLDAPDVENAARLISNSAIKQSLAAALDDWFHVRQIVDSNSTFKQAPVAAIDHFTRTVDAPARQIPYGNGALLQIARIADPDPWRDRLRDAIQRRDDDLLNKVAKEKESVVQPAHAVLLLARALEARDTKGIEAARILRQAQRRHPNEFWINFELANCLPDAQWAEQIAFYRVAVALRPDSSDAQIVLAECLRTHGNLAEAKAVADEAEAAIRKSIRSDPRYGESDFPHDGMTRPQKSDVEVEAAFREAIQLKSGLYWIYNNLGWQFVHEGRYADAEAVWRESSRIDPKHPFGPGNLGHALLLQQKFAEAEAAFRDALRLYPSYPRPLRELPEALVAQGKYKELEEVARQLVVRNPNDGLGHVKLATALVQRAVAAGETPPWDEAAAEIILAIEMSSDSASFWTPRKTVCGEFAQYDELFDRVAKLRPKEPALWIGRGQYRARLGHWHEAAADFAHVVHELPLRDETNFLYAGVLILDGDAAAYKRFCQELKARLVHQPDDARAASVVSRAFVLGPLDAADTSLVVKWAKQALDSNRYEGNGTVTVGHLPWDTQTFGLAEFRRGRNDAAIEYLQKGTGGTGWGGTVVDWIALAMTHDRLGHADEVRRCVERAIERKTMAASIPLTDWIEFKVFSWEAESLLQSAPSEQSSGAPQTDARQTVESKSAK